MPTPIHAFHDIAARYGGVDPSDTEAVQGWFMKTLPTLPPATIEEIFEALLECAETLDEEQPARSYPQGVPLPLLSQSPPVPSPLLACGWKELVNRLARQRFKS